MISTDDLIQIHMDLSDQGELNAALAEISALWATESYKIWHTGKSDRLQPYESDGAWNTLRSLGLIRESSLMVRLNKIGARYFLTDMPRLPHRFAAFPYSEEAEALLERVYAEELHLWADTIVDMSAGCGHTPLGMETEADRYVYDISARALAYAKLNARINRLPESRVSIAFGDLTRSLPLSLLASRGEKVLFLFNTPFLPNPSPSSLGAMPINADGGVDGEDFQLRSFEVVADFKRRFPEKQVKALFLTWTFGRARDGFWELQDRCEKILEGKTSWSFAPSPPGEPDPCCGIQEIFDYLQDSDYVLRKDPVVSESFAQLADAQVAKGFTHAGYGIVSYTGR